MSLNQNNSKYGLTKVFLDHWYYSNLRIKLLKDNQDGTYTLLHDKVDHLVEVRKITTNKKIYDAKFVKTKGGEKKSFLPFTPDYDVKYIYEKGEYSVLRYKYIMHVGSSRSSKSWSLVEASIRKCEESSNFRINVWRDTKESLKGSIWDDFKKVFPLSGREYSFPRNTVPIYFNNGSTIQPHGADSTNAHGVTQSVAWLNEPYKIQKEAFDQIDQRAEQIWIDLNPKEGHWSDNISKHPRCKTIHSTFQENPFCPPGQKLKILSYDPSNPINIQNKTADSYMWSVYGLGEAAEKPNKIYHNWSTTSYEEFLKLDYPEFYGLDFGQTNPTALVHIKYNDGKFYIHELLYKPEKEMSIGLVNEIKQVIDDKATPIYCDDASPEKWKELRQAGFNARPAKKGKIIDGISLIQKCQIIYTDISENIEKEYEEYEWDSDRMGLIDKPVMVNDHLLDAFRYACINARRKLKIVVE